MILTVAVESASQKVYLKSIRTVGPGGRGYGYGCKGTVSESIALYKIYILLFYLQRQDAIKPRAKQPFSRHGVISVNQVKI